MHSTVFDKVTVTSETKVQLKNNPHIEIQLTLHKLSSLDPDFKGDLMMIAYAKCNGFLTVGYF